MADIQNDILIKVNVETGDVQSQLKGIGTEIDNISNKKQPLVFSSLKTQIREATIEMQKLEQQFGLNSDQFAAGAQKVAELRDRFNDTNEAVKAFNPDNKMQGLVQVASGAITAVQGVAAAFTLIGVNSETAQLAIAKLQALMALTDALSSIDRIKNGWTALTAAISTSTIAQRANNAATVAATAIQRLFGASVIGTGAAFNVLKVAIISTGIGALLVGVGLLISYMSNLGDETNDAADAFDKLYEAKRKLLDANTQQTIDQAKIDEERSIINARSTIKNEKELKAEILKIRKKSLEDQNKALDTQIEKNNLLKNVEAANKAIDDNVKAYEKLLKQADELRKKPPTPIVIGAPIYSAPVETGPTIRDFEKQAEDLFIKQGELINKATEAGAAYNAVQGKIISNTIEISKLDVDAQLAAEEEKKKSREKSNQEREQDINKIRDIETTTIKAIRQAYLSDYEIEIDNLKAKFEQERALYLKRGIDITNLEENFRLNKIRITQTYDAKEKALRESADVVNLQAQLLKIDENNYTERRRLADEFAIQEKEAEDAAFQEKLIAAGNNQAEIVKITADYNLELINIEKKKADEIKNILEGEKQARLDAATTKTTVAETAVLKVETRQLTPGLDIESRLKLTQELYQAQRTAEEAKFAEDLIRLEGQDAEIEKRREEHRQRMIAIDKSQAEEEQAIDDARLQSKLAIYNQIGSAFGALSGLFEQGTAASKAAAIAEIAINTATGFIQGLDIAQKSAKGTGPAAAFAFPIFYATQIAAVLAAAARAKQALSQAKTKGGSGGSGSAAKPPIPPTLNTNIFNLPQEAQNVRVVNQGTSVTRAYLVQDDLRTAQEKQDFLNKLSRF